MKQGWEIKKLGEVCDIELGKTPFRGNKSFWDTEKQTDNVWLSIADLLKTDGGEVSFSKEFITDKAAKISNLVKKGTLLLSFKLTLGRLAFAGIDLYTNEAIAALIIKNKQCIDKYFLYYFLSFFDWNAATEGDVKVKGKTLNKAKLKEIDIHFPKSLPEQQRIVSILDEAFAAIAKAKANAEQNLKNAKELFESYLQGVFETKGEGWVNVKLSELATDITDGDHMPPPKADVGVHFITISNINKENHQIDFSDTFSVSKEYFQGLKANRKPKKGDVLYTVTGSYGIPVLVDTDTEFCFQRHIGLIRPKENVDSKWLFYWILSPQALKQANETATGTAQKTVSLNSLRNFNIPKMSIIEQQNIVQKLDAFSSETKRLEVVYQQKLINLEELKKSVLQKAFSGEL
jgi:type I restriction enzyme S subunit